MTSTRWWRLVAGTAAGLLVVVALLVTAADGRRQSYLRMAEILRRTRLRGHDLRTNREFHYGLVHWFLARDVHARPSTRFAFARGNCSGITGGSSRGSASSLGDASAGTGARLRSSPSPSAKRGPRHGVWFGCDTRNRARRGPDGWKTGKGALPRASCWRGNRKVSID